MAIQDETRTDLDDEVFNVIGKSVILNSLSAPVYDERGGLEAETITQTNVTIVPYNIDNDQLNQEQWGDMETGQMFAAVRYDQTININDYFTIDGENWKIVSIEKNYLPDNVVSIVRLSRIEN